MNFQFITALTNREKTFQVSFSKNEIEKLQTIKYMLEDIHFEDDSQNVAIPLEILPNSIELLKLILEVELYDKEKLKIIFTDYFQDKDNLMIKNTISSLLVFIDFIGLNKEIENIIYDISANYLINLSRELQESSQSQNKTGITSEIE